MSNCFAYLVVGSGLYGSVFARCAADAGLTVLVFDRRRHVAGNCYTEQLQGVEVHKYGPHIFHKNNRQVWNFVNRFARFKDYRHRGVV